MCVNVSEFVCKCECVCVYVSDKCVCVRAGTVGSV